MKTICVAASALLTISACRHKHDGPMLLQSPPEPQTWTSVALTVAGSEADDDKRKSCVEEAHTAGIQLAAGAPIAGTLYFLDENDYLESPSVPNGKIVFGAMGSNATCKLALSKLVQLDTIVPMSKQEPKDCKPIGSVEGSDTGFFHPGSYEAAVVEAQFMVRARGGNFFVQDAVRQEATHVVINGRGYQCAK